MKILIIAIFVWIIGVFLGSTYEGGTVPSSWAGTDTGGYAPGETPTDTLNFLFNVSNAVQHTPIIGDIPLPVPNGDYFKAWYRVVTLRFTFLQDYPMFYWIMFAPFALWGILTLALLAIAAIRGNITWG